MSDSLRNDDVDEILGDDGMENEMSGDGQDESSVMPSQEMDEWVVESTQIANNDNSVEPGQDIIRTSGEPIHEMPLSDTSHLADFQVPVDVDTVD